MDTDNWIIFSLTLYKISSLLVGLTICYFGYRLFIVGVWGNAGDLEVKFDKNNLVLKSAAPGTFFTLFGTVVIALTVWKGLELESRSGVNHGGTSYENGDAKKLPDKIPFALK